MQLLMKSKKESNKINRLKIRLIIKHAELSGQTVTKTGKHRMLTD